MIEKLIHNRIAFVDIPEIPNKSLIKIIQKASPNIQKIHNVIL